MDRGAWQAIVHREAKELNTTEQLTHTHKERYPKAQNHSIHIIK